MSEPPILETRGVSKTFGKFTALRGVSATFRRGALASIIGPNGAGKSTYFNLISGAFPPSAGSHPVQRPRHHRHGAAPVRADGDHQILPDH